MGPLSFVIVGSGWRSMFYVRIAKRFPELFSLKYLLCRTEEKAQRIAGEMGIPVTTSEQACVDEKPDFIVVAVSKASISQVTAHWTAMGFPVLCETPAAATVEELKELWRLSEEGARIQVAEQYYRYPAMAAGLKFIEDGKLGEPDTVRLSVAHDYHGASLIRRMLHMRGPDPVSLIGRPSLLPVMQTDSRQGPITDGSVKEEKGKLIFMEFASGKTALYDFASIQYRSFIRCRHVNVQGQNGEWNDTVVRYAEPAGGGACEAALWKPEEQRLHFYLDPYYKQLETPELQALAEHWNPFLQMENEQDEYAIATMMYDMREFLENEADGGRRYPLAEALEDAYLWILMQEAVAKPGEVIRSERMPWHGGKGED